MNIPTTPTTNNADQTLENWTLERLTKLRSELCSFLHLITVEQAGEWDNPEGNRKSIEHVILLTHQAKEPWYAK